MGRHRLVHVRPAAWASVLALALGLAQACSPPANRQKCEEYYDDLEKARFDCRLDPPELTRAELCPASLDTLMADCTDHYEALKQNTRCDVISENERNFYTGETTRGLPDGGGGGGDPTFVASSGCY